MVAGDKKLQELKACGVWESAAVKLSSTNPGCLTERNICIARGLTEALDLIMWSGRLRLQQYFMALLASLLKTMRKKKTKGPWRVGQQTGRGKVRKMTGIKLQDRWEWGAHLHTVEPGEQVVEDDHVAVDGEERQETRDWGQEENATCGLKARAAENTSHETDKLNVIVKRHNTPATTNFYYQLIVGPTWCQT